VSTAPPIPPALKRKDAAEELGQSTIGSTYLILQFWQIARSFGAFLLVLKVFLILALLGVFLQLSPLLHSLSIALFCVAGFISFIRGWRRVTKVSEYSARRAVERASALPHRPLTSITDTPVAPSALWQRHRVQLAGLLKQAKLRRPDFSALRLDHRALRLGSWVVLVAALLIAWEQAPQRLRSATHPPLEQLLPTITLDAWVTPPEYTGQPPFALVPEQAAVSIPESSQINLRVTGGWFTPKAILGENSTRLSQDGEGSYMATLPVTAAGELRIKQDGRTLGRWELRLLLDTPPQISFSKPPGVSDQSALRLDYTAIDDVGLSTITATLEPSAIAADSPDNAPLELTLPLRQPPPQEANGFRFFDLTAHPWSGSEVLITLTATDSKSQSASSATEKLKLPERRFSNPIAKALIKMRKELTARGMGVRRDIMTSLNRLAGEAEDNYVGDWVGALALRVMVERLRLSDNPANIPGLSRLMWDTALHFEDGGTQQALRHLREAQQALEDALSKGADSAELNQLMQELQQAMREYMDQLQEQQQELPEQSEQQAGESISRDQLEQFLEQLQQMMENGQTEQAQQMLQQLQELMENLQNGQSGQMDEQMQQALRELEDIQREQSEMMGQTQEHCDNPGASGTPSEQGQEQGQQQGTQQGQNGLGGGQLPQSVPALPLPGDQGELRDRLGSVIDELKSRGLGTGEFEQGGEAMDRAEDKLFERDGPGALREQKDALERLRQGMNELQEQMAQQQPRDPNSDPLGRKKGSTGSDTSAIEIPEAQEADRARKLLEELRRRAGEYNRPTEERDYLDRLLKWF
jgi:uncharacterized protein (TIGR02302 family)